MNIVFYTAKFSSAAPVEWALAELQVPHERVQLDLSKGTQRTPEFLKLNPNGKVPTLVVDGVPMFEGLAINLWLADRFGVEKRLWPRPEAPERGVAMSFATWAYVTYGSAFIRRAFATGQRQGDAFRNQALAEQSEQEIGQLHAILEQRLADRPYLIGEGFSLADLIVASSVGYAVQVGNSLGANARVSAWLERCQARPCLRALYAG